MGELSETEREALHELQLGVEQVYRAYGRLLGFHHSLGRGMDHLDAGEQLLREVGHEAYADALRDDHLPAGAVGDEWSYELVEEFRHGLLAAVSDFENEVREDLSGGTEHVTERKQRQEWRERADRDERD